MNRVLTSRVLRFAAASFLSVGIAFALASSGAIYVAQLGSGGGMTTVELPYQVTESVRLESLHGAAFAEPLGSAVLSQFVIGMLLVVAGVCFHALWLIRFGHLRASKKKEPRRAAWIAEIKEWMERGMDRHFHV